MTQTATPAAARMPAGIPFIVVNEFAERFCFYGVTAILVQYMIQFLHFGDAKATGWQAMFKSAAYFFPLLGAMISDIFLAKFRTIIYFSIVYVAGCTVLAIATTPTLLVLGMFLMAFGTGGIKPCVSTNVGDQFTSANQHLIERAFSYFYFSINLGSSISIFFCPELLASPDYGPRWAFGMPAVMMALATMAFWLGRKKFAVVPAAIPHPGFAPLAFIAVFLAMLAVAVVVFTRTTFLFALFVMLGELALAVWLSLNTGLKNFLPTPLVAWMRASFTGENLRTIGRLALLFGFFSMFWALWDQSNGNSWTVQAQSGLMDKHPFRFLAVFPLSVSQAGVTLVLAVLSAINYLVFKVVVSFVISLIRNEEGTAADNTSLKVKPFAIAWGLINFIAALFIIWSRIPQLPGFELLPSQLTVVNGLFILTMLPLFTFVIYPLAGRFFTVTPLRKIGVGLFVTASSFLVVAWIESRIQSGHAITMWWQMLAYAIVSAGEVLVWVTGLEYSYKQAPPVMKSFVMSLALLSTSVGNALTATVNELMVRPLVASAIETGAETWVRLEAVDRFVVGQKIDLAGTAGITTTEADGKTEPLEGTYLIGAIDTAAHRVKLVEKVDREPVVSSGATDASKASISTYALVGPMYFLFFAALMAALALVYIIFAMWLKEKTYVREDEVAA